MTGSSHLEPLLGSSAKQALVLFALDQIQTDTDVDHVYRNKSELARDAGVGRSSVYKHLPELVEMGLYESTETTTTRYRANTDSAVLEALAKLHVALELDDDVGPDQAEAD